MQDTSMTSILRLQLLSTSILSTNQSVFYTRRSSDPFRVKAYLSRSIREFLVAFISFDNMLQFPFLKRSIRSFCLSFRF